MAEIIRVECVTCEISGVAILADGDTPYCYNCDTPAKILTPVESK